MLCCSFQARLISGFGWYVSTCIHIIILGRLDSLGGRLVLTNRNTLVGDTTIGTGCEESGPVLLVGVQGISDGYKRPFDLAFLILSHLLLFPIWLLLWTFIPLAIWMEDRGPVFYVQERLGQGGKPFGIIKFRTMIRHAEALTGQVWASENDERVTRVGRTLRKLRLDEMPQVVNIIRGEMSLVGPRPERPMLARQFDKQVPGFSQRLSVKPGVAGLAQLRGGYAASPRNKLRYDVLYIKRMNLWLDLRLLFVSVPVMIGHCFKKPRV